QRSLTFERDGQHQDIRSGAGPIVLHAADPGLISDPGLDCRGRLHCPTFLARAYDHGLSSPYPAQSKAHAGGPGSPNDGNRACWAIAVPTHANSASSDCSALNSSNGSLMLIRE